MPRLLALLLLALASGASGQPLRIVDVAVGDQARLEDGTATILLVQVSVHRGGVVCVTTPCPQAPPRRTRFRLAVEIDSVASASVHAERTFRAHSSHTLAVPLALDLVGHASGGERVLWGTARLFQNGEPTGCQRFRIYVNAPEAARRPPLAQAERRCTPTDSP